jgi:hypothetical protein
VLSWQPDHSFIVEDTGGSKAAELTPEPAAVV